MKRNQLSNIQFHHLANWIKKNKSRLITSELSKADIAEEASTELQFPVTQHNLRDALDLAGIQMPGRKKPTESNVLLTKAMVHAILTLANQQHIVESADPYKVLRQFCNDHQMVMEF